MARALLRHFPPSRCPPCSSCWRRRGSRPLRLPVLSRAPMALAWSMLMAGAHVAVGHRHQVRHARRQGLRLDGADVRPLRAHLAEHPGHLDHVSLLHRGSVKRDHLADLRTELIDLLLCSGRERLIAAGDDDGRYAIAQGAHWARVWALRSAAMPKRQNVWILARSCVLSRLTNG
jgi:hypothetical protein